MDLIFTSILISFASIVIIPLLPLQFKKGFAIISVIASGILNGLTALRVLWGVPLKYSFNANFFFGEVILRINNLSAFFILITTFTLITGICYGYFYMKQYDNEVEKQSLHWSFYILLQISMLLVCITDNIIAFIFVWELMTISAFILIIYEFEKKSVIKAGLNYFIQSHLSVLLLIVGFLWLWTKTGATDFYTIAEIIKANPQEIGPLPFMILATGFAFKAGFIPLHTWLPWAHPAAPSHISGVMSGIIIKMGIFGIFKIIPFYQGNILSMGRLILIISVFTALYGVILAIIQHNLKKLLAYHSIENIGIIGMGIGIGMIGIGLNNSYIALAGFSGALLHTFNHSLFKSLLFFTAGSVYRKTHILDIDELGGLIKKMPWTAGFFLIAALAITGLPPFNGFISEFLIYNSLYSGMLGSNLSLSMIFLCSIFGLVMVGGLAFLCFTKAFGIIFLGVERSALPQDCSEVEKAALIPQFFIILFIIAIGILPYPFVKIVTSVAATFINYPLDESFIKLINTMSDISAASLFIITLTIVVYLLKLMAGRNHRERTSPTWGCGYTNPTPKLQYTATSFVSSYTRIASPLLKISIKTSEIKEYFPVKGWFHSSSYDKIEEKLIDKNLKRIGSIMRIFGFLQNGLIQYYILYGMFFIIAIIGYTFREAIVKFILSSLAIG
ncbi:MAG: Hydrogenase-4 component B [Spirochaetes bacterium ADurb.Bin218]|jgi:formate hydrogenlyase subunit 3/multisubunit Na+/H+ antiporter MnhD subunit|nr:MAG: Hydrogenase-4 component B [Spirochaetes bacterium ADurb.Bin218]